MPVRTIQAPHLGAGRTLKLGRNRPVGRAPQLRLSSYLRGTLPPAPDNCDYSARGQPALSNAYLNDQLGDCVIAGGYHVVAVETGNAGRLFTATNEQLIADYGAIGGYVPGNSNTDNGCDEPTAFNYWMQHGFADGAKLLGAVAIDATNIAELKSAQYLFENLYFGVELPDEWLAAPANGFIWDVGGAPNPENGHCIMGVGYTAQGVTVDSWGLLGTVTWAALARYFVPGVNGAAYALLTPDELAKAQNRAPNGVAWSALIADFDAIGGQVPAPDPAPSPSNVNLQTMLGIQQALNLLGANPQLTVDGIEGARTRAAIESFQAAHDLAVDGIIGRNTRAALQLALNQL